MQEVDGDLYVGGDEGEDGGPQAGEGGLHSNKLFILISNDL